MDRWVDGVEGFSHSLPELKTFPGLSEKAFRIALFITRGHSHIPPVFSVVVTYAHCVPSELLRQPQDAWLSLVLGCQSSRLSLVLTGAPSLPASLSQDLPRTPLFFSGPGLSASRRSHIISQLSVLGVTCISVRGNGSRAHSLQRLGVRIQLRPAEPGNDLGGFHTGIPDPELPTFLVTHSAPLVPGP